MPGDEFPSATLDDMISHEDVQLNYPWLGSHILNRWRRQGKIRYFRGKRSLLYSRKELDLAIESDMRVDVVEERQKPKPPLPSDRQRKDQAQADVIREEFSLRSIFSHKGELSSEWLEHVNARRSQVGLPPTSVFCKKLPPRSGAPRKRDHEDGNG